MLARAALIAALALLLLPSAAMAGGRVIDQATAPAAGPVLAGDHAAWATWSGRALEVRRSPDGGATHEVGSFPISRYPRASLVASAERLTVTATEYNCSSELCKYQDYFTTFADLTTGPPGGPLTSVRRCVTDTACQEQPCEDAVGASGDVVLFHTCVVGPYRLHDFATGQDYPLPERMENPVIAGDYLADAKSRAVAVYNWRTNTEVLRLPTRSSGTIALQADGTVAFADGDPSYPQQRELYVVSPSEQTPKRVLITSGGLGPIVFAGDRILYSTAYTAAGGRPFGVVDTDGSEILTERTGTTWTGFDGRRLVGTDRACGLHAIVEWDLQGEVPSLPAGRCPAMTVARAARSLSSTNGLAVRVTCPATPALGCRGEVSLIGYPKPKGSPRAATFGVDLDPGETFVHVVRLPARSLCAAKRGKVTLTVTTTSGGGDADNPAARWKGRITAAGVKKIPRSCGRRR